MTTDLTTTDDAVLAVDVDIVVIIRCGATTNDCATIRLMIIIIII